MFLCFVLDSLIYSPCLRNSLKSEDKIDDKSIARSSVILLRLQITEKEKKSFFVGYVNIKDFKDYVKVGKK